MKARRPRPPIEPIQWTRSGIFLLDQRLLPSKERYVRIRSLKEAVWAIKEMVVRGAPAIGVTAALALALEARKQRVSGGKFLSVFAGWSRTLGKSRPTAVNLRNALDYMQAAARTLVNQNGMPVARGLEHAALKYLEDDLAANYALNCHGVALVKKLSRGQGPVNILTICNTGSLATSGFGTALGVIQEAFRRGRRVHVYACETRPWLQGSRLTTWELKKSGISHTLIADGAAAFLMKRTGVDLVITGADRITRQGDVANKIGTYALAVLARQHGVPFYVAAPMTTFDPSLNSGDDITIEERKPEELTFLRGVPLAPAKTKAWNPVFDVTPASLVRAYVTEKGILKAGDIAGLMA
ncbi:MAG: S-methyl-5-thioribose-1-phosphate isomerase [Elusimicrobia bacterium]|nr:S-methyl-5-thioribose-1-phosphate isomerase [Elusimicrobiota bacterium]